MRTTIDMAGRLVVPKSIRDQLGLKSGSQLELRVRDGRLEVEPVIAEPKLVRKGRFLVFAPPDDGTPPLTNEDINKVLDEVRFERVKEFLDRD